MQCRRTLFTLSLPAASADNALVLVATSDHAQAAHTDSEALTHPAPFTRTKTLTVTSNRKMTTTTTTTTIHMAQTESGR
ncbi:hypothetical protein BC827DRAFT_1219950 [Russula dissimulans]|nr:hypothetical protein BC827DRAFT_1219950 [Russula dissimulans]